MNERPEDRVSLSAEEAGFVDRLAERYSPSSLSAPRRAALDAELHERITTPRMPRFVRPAFASAAIGLAVGLALVVASYDPDTDRRGTVITERGTVAAWESDLLDPAAFDDFDAGDDLEELPDDYAAIAGIFLDG